MQIDGHDANVDGFDNVLVEILEALVLTDFLFERGVEPGILNGDADVSGKGLQQFDVFAGEEVALHGFAEAEKGDGLLPCVARNVVIEIEASDGFLRGRVLARQLARVFEEDVSGGVFDAGLGQKRQINPGEVSNAERL